MRSGQAGLVSWGGQRGRRGLDLAFLYSVQWNLFNVSLVWADSHVPPRWGTWDTVQQQVTRSLGTGRCAVDTAQCRGEGETRPNRTWTPIRSLPGALFFLPLFCPLLLPLSPSSLSLPSLSSSPPPLPCLCRALYVLSI